MLTNNAVTKAASGFIYHLLQLRMDTCMVNRLQKDKNANKLFGCNVYRIRNSYRKLRIENAHKIAATRFLCFYHSQSRLGSCLFLAIKTPFKDRNAYKAYSIGKRE